MECKLERRYKMKKPRFFVVLSSSLISILVASLIVCFGMSIALYSKSVDGNGTYGEISLRSYYESGSGTEEDPFIITRPRHLYNLSRLQGLGIYGEKKYFQLGKVDLGGVNSNGVPMCYINDSSSEQKPYLDMSTSDRDTNPINAIGSEALPFYGEFDGQNVEIKNLNVYANPQDAGLFGYTAHGSKVQNIFLTDITIHALGYTSDYADLYNPNSDIGDDAYFIYEPNDGSDDINFVKGFGSTEFTYYYANNLEDFEYDAVASNIMPTISIQAPSNSYTFSSLLSGDLITFDSDGKIVPDLERVFEFFKEKREEEGAKFPIQASSAASLIVSSVDRYGQKHSKVLLSAEFDFTLESSTTNIISMGARVGGDHGNNIGLVVGHCDGTVQNCYVYNGSFDMNNGGSGYNRLPNGSNLGLIGRVGGTVQNVLANESDTGAKEGKNIGVLDFTTIYSDIINDNSFNGSHAAAGVTAGVTYNPNGTSKYIQYLRSYNGNYITIQEDAVSFKGRSIVTNTDLGVFTIATDARTSGTNSDAGQNIDRSVVMTDDDLTIDDASGNDNYYIYYSTGEYIKSYHNKYSTGTTFANYLDSYNDRKNIHFLPGYHFPNRNHVSRDSFETREARQNYYVRFKLDPNYRKGKGFYFSDVDTDTDGGAFLANYFNYKLVDQNSYHIPVGDNKCGVMLKNNLRQEIGSFSASFACPDYKDVAGLPTNVYCLEDEDDNRYINNMVNFEIKNDLANVTVIAAPTDISQPAALGVYKLDDNDFTGTYDAEHDVYELKFKQKYNDPDYAFFMPTDNNLTYFDYRVNTQTHKGEVGVYDAGGTFTVADNTTDATVPKEYNKTEFGYEANKTRLFAHTFCLPRGRYCIGSASKTENGQCVPKIYYICAQGQDDGQFDFDDNVFASTDRVENVDFINIPRFSDAGVENIVISDISSYNPSNPTDANKLGNRRLYVALVNSDRSEFGDSIASNLSFTYDPSTGKFKITSTLTGQQLASVITHVAVDNYQPSLPNSVQKHLTVVLIDIESDGQVIVYPLGN